MSQQFVHLHSHTDHSPLDGHASVKLLAARVHEMGQPGFGITDHGKMSNTYNGWKAAEDLGMKFLPGVEAYVAPGDTDQTVHDPVFFGSGNRENKEERSNDVSGGGAYTHLTMLAETSEGMHNLFRLNTQASQKGNYKKNRMDIASIASMSSGIIATTGCPSGELQTRIRLGQWEEALAYAAKMQDIFGKDNYFLELMDHNMTIDLERKVRGDLMQVAKILNIPLLATNDLHYVDEGDAKDHEHLLCLQSGSSMSELPYDQGGKRFAFEGSEYYAKSVGDMIRLFPEEEYPGAISNTVRIAERASATFNYNPDLRPSVPLPEGYTEDSYLREQAYEGLARKRPEKVNDPEYIERLEKELEVFRVKNFSGYMLVVSDFMRWAKAQGWQCGPARGSGGGSLLAFATDITEIDPIPHGLIFERFLNPERDSPPDIDSDFDDVNREKVIDYVRQKYGEETVSMIITFGMLKAKSAIKDVARILDQPYSVGENLTKVLPPAVSGVEVSLSQIFNKDDKRYIESEAFRSLANQPDNKRIVDAARGIEGKMKSTGVHAAGVIMSSKPLVDSIPLMMRKADGVMISEFDYPTCEALGLIKMDFLGIRNLTVIDKAIKAIHKNHGILLNSHEIYDSVLTTHDEKTYDLLKKGQTLGIFQLDSPPIASLLKAIAPDKFGDLSATIALYRPGPMGMNSHNEYADRKNGRKPVIPIHPELEEPLAEIVGETYGIIAYQEQVMAIAQKLANYTMGEADNLRRAMGKKKKSVLDAEFPMFETGMKKNGYSDDAIETIWNTLIPFAEYGFNKTLKYDTLVERNSSNQYEPDPMISLQKIWDRFYGEESQTHVGKKYRKQGLVIRGYDKDTKMITKKRVIDIHDHGELELWKITLSNGSVISASINHRHMTPNGWKTVGELKVGDLLTVDTQSKISHLGDTYDRGDRVMGAGKNWNRSETRMLAADGYMRPAIHGINSALNAVKRELPDYCEFCGKTEGRLEAAHLDNDRTNNTRENVKKLCNKCHKTHDADRRGGPWPKGTLSGVATIESIEFDGIHQAYDLEVEGETDMDHNYVANGVVTHNSHSAGYGLISYITAFLKANYPAEFMAANLSTLTSDKTKTALYLEDCRHMGLEVSAPSVAFSTADYTAVDANKILVGLGAIRGVGHDVAHAIAVEAEKNGPYKSLDNFLARAPVHALSKGVIEGLAHAGALDGFGYSRRTLKDYLPEAARGFVLAKKKESAGQFSLFDDEDGVTDEDSVIGVILPDLPEYTKKDKLAFERHALGLYVSDHPLSGITRTLDKYADTKIVDILSGSIPVGQSFGDKKKVTLAGVVNSVTRKPTKKGEMFAMFTLEDVTGTIPCLMFPKTFQRLGDKITTDNIYKMTGTLLQRDSEDDISFSVDQLEEIEVTDDGLIPYTLRLYENQVTDESMMALNSVIAAHPGDMPVYVHIISDQGMKVFKLDASKNIENNMLFHREVMMLFGTSAV